MHFRPKSFLLCRGKFQRVQYNGHGGWAEKAECLCCGRVKIVVSRRGPAGETIRVVLKDEKK